MDVMDDDQLREVLENIDVKEKKKVDYDLVDTCLGYIFIVFLGLGVFAILVALFPVVLILVLVYAVKNICIKLWRKVWKSQE